MYLETWLVQDGEVPELSSGDSLGPAGLRIIVDPGSGRNIDESSRLEHSFTGTAGAEIVLANGWRDPSTVEFTLTTPNGRFIAAAGVGGPGFRAGSEVTLSGEVEVIPAYEFDDFGLPDVRSLWRVLAVAAEDRASVADATGTGYPGPLVQRRKLDRMRMWDDDDSRNDQIITTYLVQLEPL